MSQQLSPSTGKRYGLVRVCRVVGFPRSTLYARRRVAVEARVLKKRGPKGKYTDAEVVEHIKADLDSSPWVGEGHRKVHARLRTRDVRVSKDRILRLMRLHGLLAPTRAGKPHGPRAHDGTITTDAPDVMWGTDATTTMTLDEGTANVFVVIDHCTAECLGLFAAKRGTRWEAIEAMREAVRLAKGSYGEGVGSGTVIRHDHGSPFISDAYQSEIRFLGLVSSPSFVREPQGNGIAERFIKTLKEQLLWIHAFRTVDELQDALKAFQKRYNDQWLLARHRHRSPSSVRESFLRLAA